MRKVNITVTVKEQDAKRSHSEYERAVDELGWIVLPKEFRQAVGIRMRDMVSIKVDKGHNAIVLTKKNVRDEEGILIDEGSYYVEDDDEY